MVTWLMHMIAYNALYKSYRIKNSSGVIWGHRGQKVIRIQKIISARCNIARWCHLVRWKIIYQCCLSWHGHGFKGHLGSFPVPAKIGWNGQNQLYLGIWRNDQAHHSLSDRTFDGQYIYGGYDPKSQSLWVKGQIFNMVQWEWNLIWRILKAF